MWTRLRPYQKVFKGVFPGDLSTSAHCDSIARTLPFGAVHQRVDNSLTCCKTSL